MVIGVAWPVVAVILLFSLGSGLIEHAPEIVKHVKSFKYSQKEESVEIQLVEDKLDDIGIGLKEIQAPMEAAETTRIVALLKAQLGGLSGSQEQSDTIHPSEASSQKQMYCYQEFDSRKDPNNQFLLLCAESEQKCNLTRGHNPYTTQTDCKSVPSQSIPSKMTHGRLGSYRFSKEEFDGADLPQLPKK
jgi:hypothetical protein